MRIKLTALSILLFASVGWSLNSNVTFNSLNACKSAYKTSGNADAADEFAQDKFCATRVPSLAGTGAVGTATAASTLDVCIQTKFQNLLAKTPDLNVIAQQNAKDQFRVSCTQEQVTRDQQAANVGAQQAQVAAQQAQAQAAAEAKAAAKSGGGASKGGGDKDPDFAKIIGDVGKAFGITPKSIGAEIGKKVAGDKPASAAAAPARPAAAKTTEEAKPESAATTPAKPTEEAKDVPVTEADRKAVAGTGSTPEERAAAAKAEEDKFKASQDGKGTTADAPKPESPKPIVQDDVTGVDAAAAEQARIKAESSPASAPDSTTPSAPAAKTETTPKDEVDGGIATNQDGSLKTAAQIDEDLKKPVPADQTETQAATFDKKQADDLAAGTAGQDPKAGCDAEFGCKGDFDKAIADEAARKEEAGEKIEPATNEQVDAAIQNGEAAEKEIADTSAALKSETGADLKGGLDEAKTEGAKAAQTKITQGAQTANQKLQSVVTEIGTMAQTFEPADLGKSMQALMDFQTKFNSFVTESKEKCVKATEASDKLCKKETSPIQAAVAKASQIAGPILKSIDSASKVLSVTGDLAKASAAGLTAANAACGTAKKACDGVCGKATADVEKLMAAELKKFQSTFQGELAQKMQECEDAGNFDMPPPFFCPNLFSAMEKVSAGVPKITTALGGEKTPQPLGTVASLTLKCSVEHAADMGALGKLIGDLMKSAAGAKAGAKKLSSGNGAGVVKIATYCEQPDNKTTQFCTCQKNPLGKDCPGAITNAIDTAKKKAELAGKDLKSSSTGASGFASGFKPTTALGAGINGKVGALKLNSKDANKNTSGFTAGKNNFGGGVGGGTVSGSGKGSSGFGSSSGSSSRDPASTEKGNNAPKKFSFGSFASLGGGGGRGGGGSSAKKANGILLKKQLDAIKRQLASDKIAEEVSPASGKTNWDKIREMYTIQSKSLIIGK